MSRYAGPSGTAQAQGNRLRAQGEEEQANRDELFSSNGGATAGTSARDMPEQEMNVDQLVRKAEDVHKSTTRTAEQARRVLNDTKTQQAAIMTELDSQDERMRRMDQKVTQINEDLTYAERVLRYMRRCCCCWLCDSCTGADPDKQIKKQWDKDVEKGRTNKPNETYLGPKGAGNGAGAGPGRAGASASNGSGPGQQNMYRDPDIRLGDEHKAAEMRMREETRKQNEILDEIHAGLGQIHSNAKAIGSKIEQSTKDFEGVGERIQDTRSRIKNANKKSILADFKAKD